MKLKNALKYGLYRTFGLIEPFVVSRGKDYPDFSPIFIVGPARSGTTLVYQSLTSSYKTSYFTNVMNSLFVSPVTTAKLLKIFHQHRKHQSFESNYGKTEGYFGLNQGNSFWDRWYPKYNEYESKNNVTDGEKIIIQKTIAGIESIYGTPFVNKWPGHVVHLLSLNDIFPNAIYIWVIRNYAFNAQSVLKGRLELLNDPDKSISRLPLKSFLYKDAHYIEKVCIYIEGVHEEIEEASKIIGKNRFIKIKYEDLCEKPQEEMEKIGQTYLDISGIPLESLNHELKSFKVSESIKINKDDWDKINDYFEAKKL